jgi:hypothetical protein
MPICGSCGQMSRDELVAEVERLMGQRDEALLAGRRAYRTLLHLRTALEASPESELQVKHDGKSVPALDFVRREIEALDGPLAPEPAKAV